MPAVLLLCDEVTKAPLPAQRNNVFRNIWVYRGRRKQGIKLHVATKPMTTNPPSPPRGGAVKENFCKSGVPQGSVLGQFFFFYTNYLPQKILSFSPSPGEESLGEEVKAFNNSSSK